MAMKGFSMLPEKWINEATSILGAAINPCMLNHGE